MPRDNSVIDLRRRSVRVSSFLPPWDFVMLEPAFTFARPHPDPQATLPPDVLAPSLGAVSGTHPGGRTLQALFLPQVTETFAPARAIFWPPQSRVVQGRTRRERRSFLKTRAWLYCVEGWPAILQGTQHPVSILSQKQGPLPER